MQESLKRDGQLFGFLFPGSNPTPVHHPGSPVSLQKLFFSLRESTIGILANAVAKLEVERSPARHEISYLGCSHVLKTPG